MPESDYEILNARVKQKIDTETNWLANEDTFGVIFEGEQAFVKNDDGTPVNFKIGDGTKKFSELAYFIAYYSNVTNQKVLPYLNKTANIIIPSVFKVNSYLTDIIFLNTFGSTISLKVGTTDGGNEIASIDLTTGISCIELRKYFDSTETLYLTGLTGTSFSMFVLYIQLDEAPAIPPSSPVTAFRWPKGFRGTFEPLYPGHENDVWDFSTGFGKPNTGYDNCRLSGTGGTDDVSDAYEVGWKVGDTIGGLKGSNANISLVAANIPKLKVTLPANKDAVHGVGGIVFGGAHNNDVDVSVNADDGLPTDNPPTSFSVRPKSIVSLKFVAYTD